MEIEEWRVLLQQAVNAGKTPTQIAADIGVARSTVSAIVCCTPSSPYNNGKANPARIAERVLTVYGQYPCPFLTEGSGHPELVNVATCRRYSGGEQPTHNPGAAAHWRACQGCERKPAPVVLRVIHERGPKGKPEPVGAAKQIDLMDQYDDF